MKKSLEVKRLPLLLAFCFLLPPFLQASDEGAAVFKTENQASTAWTKNTEPQKSSPPPGAQVFFEGPLTTAAPGAQTIPAGDLGKSLPAENLERVETISNEEAQALLDLLDQAAPEEVTAYSIGPDEEGAEEREIPASPSSLDAEWISETGLPEEEAGKYETLMDETIYPEEKNTAEPVSLNLEDENLFVFAAAPPPKKPQPGLAEFRALAADVLTWMELSLTDRYREMTDFIDSLQIQVIDLRTRAEQIEQLLMDPRLRAIDANPAILNGLGPVAAPHALADIRRWGAELKRHQERLYNHAIFLDSVISNLDESRRRITTSLDPIAEFRAGSVVRIREIREGVVDAVNAAFVTRNQFRLMRTLLQGGTIRHVNPQEMAGFGDFMREGGRDRFQLSNGFFTAQRLPNGNYHISTRSGAGVLADISVLSRNASGRTQSIRDVLNRLEKLLPALRPRKE